MGMPTTWNWRQGRSSGYEYEQIKPSDKMTTKTDRISEEQAVQVAEWLGYEITMVSGVACSESGGMLLPTWHYLDSPEGQEALMDKLESEGWDIWNEQFLNPDLSKSRTVILGKIETDNESAIYSARAKTRQHALLLALLEMLKGGGE